MESKGSFFNFKVAVFPKMIYYLFYFLENSQAHYKTFRMETTMTKSVKNIAEHTKENLAKNNQIANSKATSPKFRI